MESGDDIAGTRDVETPESEVKPIGERVKLLSALFPSQSFLEFPSLYSGGIQEVVHVGVLDVESVEKSVDSCRDGGEPRGSDPTHGEFRPAQGPGRFPPPGAVCLSSFVPRRS